MRQVGAIMFSRPMCSTLSSSFSDRSAFFSRCIKAFLFFVDGPGSGDNGRVGELPSVGELQGVTVGEKFCPDGVFRAEGVTAFMPRSLRTDAKPMLTENVLHELRRERLRGVGGALKSKVVRENSKKNRCKTYVVCLETTRDSIRDETCDGGRLKVTLDVPSSGCITVLLVKV